MCIENSERSCESERKQMAVSWLKIGIPQQNLHVLCVWTVFEAGDVGLVKISEKSEGSGLSSRPSCQ